MLNICVLLDGHHVHIWYMYNICEVQQKVINSDVFCNASDYERITEQHQIDATPQLFTLQFFCFQKVTPPFQPSKREICTAFGTLFLLFVRFW